MSVVNLNPGSPPSLDDAFAVTHREMSFQYSVLPAIYQEQAGGKERSRIQTLHDVRYGFSENVEFTVGANSLRGSELTPSLEDRAAIRVSVLTRLVKPVNQGVTPHVSLRFQGNVPLESGTMFKGSLIATWAIGQSWWLSSSLWHAISEGEGPSLWGVRHSLTGVTTGAVHAISPEFSVVMNASYHENHVPPFGGERYIFVPEVGLVWLFHRQWQLTASVGRDFLGVPGNSILQGRVGLSFGF